MSETRHTPGEWEVHHSGEGTTWVQEVDPARGHKVICDIPGDAETHEGEDLANADLIAAAPTLVKVAREVWSALDEVRSRDARWLGPKLREAHSRLGEVVARAEGGAA